MKLGIVGLPNVGKSSLFNALAGARAAVASFPFSTVEPNVGIAPLHDHRLEAVARIFGSARVTPAAIKYIDIAGLVEGASRGEGLGNRFLAHIREADAILHVVRCFQREDVSHAAGPVDPARDVEIVNTELILADIESIERRRERLKTHLKTGDPEYRWQDETLAAVSAELDRGKAIRELQLDAKAREWLYRQDFLTAKPVLYVANVGEDELEGPVSLVEELREAVGEAPVVVLSAALEQELSELDPAERREFLSEWGLEERPLDLLIKASFALLDLITFITANDREARAWTIEAGTPAVVAAGKVHTDMARGFVAAEVIPAQRLMEVGSMARAKEAGMVRLEGRDYEVQDGDVIQFRFNVS